MLNNKAQRSKEKLNNLKLYKDKKLMKKLMKKPQWKENKRLKNKN